MGQFVCRNRGIFGKNRQSQKRRLAKGQGEEGPADREKPASGKEPRRRWSFIYGEPSRLLRVEAWTALLWERGEWGLKKNNLGEGKTAEGSSQKRDERSRGGILVKYNEFIYST